MFLAGGLIAGGALVALDDPMHPALGGAGLVRWRRCFTASSMTCRGQ